MGEKMPTKVWIQKRQSKDRIKMGKWTSNPTGSEIGHKTEHCTKRAT